MSEYKFEASVSIIFLLLTAKDCGTLSNPAKGHVSHTGTTYGKTATYSCNTGYDLEGTSTRTCQSIQECGLAVHLPVQVATLLNHASNITTMSA